MENNPKNGTKIVYGEDGKITKDGIEIVYGKDGKITQQKDYRDGKLIKILKGKEVPQLHPQPYRTTPLPKDPREGR